MKKEIVSEFISTFILVFTGCSAIVTDKLYNNLGALGISLVFGMSVTLLIIAFGKISGAHMNPAVTISLAVSKNIEKKKVIPYIISQILGAITGALLISFLFSETGKNAKELAYLGATLPSGSSSQSFILEILLTFILMIVIYMSAVNPKGNKHLAPFAIGFTVAIDALFGGAISGASMNPARSIGPAIISGNINYLWIYITAPIIGSLIAAGIYKIFKESEVDLSCCKN
ncbi:MIP/aquaporin family protein [Desulfurobacterium atlanticum]|uniref:Aquaporin Z n=1 Tax=Desulfurobacterium atlanticum TaxID=240169 RepID=A0A238YCM6_9BACT|nr:MIP/aquaporin family protein [Desulfurobacterium atlanticum]SNR68363.1 aquaporin Z [Desulfurobacterium atlanticum]